MEVGKHYMKSGKYRYTHHIYDCSLLVGLCLYDINETFLGLWMLVSSEGMMDKRDEEYTYANEG